MPGSGERCKLHRQCQAPRANQAPDPPVGV